MMTAEDVVKAIVEEDMLEAVTPFWDEAMAGMPDGPLPFLDPAAVIENRQWGGLEESLDASLLATAAYISADKALRCLAWYCYWRVFEAGRDNLATVPALKTLPGDMGSLFYLLIGMAMVPRLREYHRTLRIPEEITRTTAGQISCICGNYRRAHAGRPGVFINQLAWLRHIPAGGGMPLEACRDSLQQAADFFRKRFPERSPAAFCTVSWIFSPQLEQVLPRDSNMVKLQRELYLYPWPSISQSVWFIFFQNVFDPATAPRDTSLQRAVYDYLVDNRYWRNQAMFFLLDDLPEFGRQVYRSRVPAIVDTADKI